MRTEPIMEWESLEQARRFLKYWQNILYLDDWVIDIAIEEIFEEPNRAFIEKDHNVKSARISFEAVTDEVKNLNTLKYCAELLLVHELCHCIFDTAQSDSIEGIEFDTLQHQRAEFMARSLIRARYGLDSEWFSGIGGAE